MSLPLFLKVNTCVIYYEDIQDHLHGVPKINNLGWSQICCVPEKGKESKPYKEALAEYCKSENMLKEY
jgi:hypothetical protein